MGVEISLAGKNAVVTGDGGGMGRTTSMLLGQAGANVMVADMDVAAAEKTAADIARAVRRQDRFLQVRCHCQGRGGCHGGGHSEGLRPH